MKLAFFIAIIILQCICVIDVLMRWISWRKRQYSFVDQPIHGGKCTSCSSIDPVSDPSYNMREIAKQSILLEEHLTIVAKFCPDCCVKHLLHLHGLATEALMLAGRDVNNFPLLVDATIFYQKCIDDWHNLVRNADPIAQPEPRLQLSTDLREFRKRVVSAYF